MQDGSNLDSLLGLGAEEAARGAADLADDVRGLPPGEADARLLDLVARLDVATRDLLPCTERDLGRQGTRMVAGLSTLRALRDRALPALGEPPTDPVAEVRRESVWLRRLAPQEFRGLALLNALDDHLDRARVDELSVLARENTALDDPGRLLQRIAYEQIALEGTGNSALVERLDGIREDFWTRIKERLAGDPVGSETWFRRLADAINDRSEDRLSQVESLDPGQAFHALELARRDVRETLALAREHGFKRRARELARMRRRLYKAWQDHTVRSRQTAQVGRRALRLIEYGILVLIILVLALLVFMSTADVEPEVERVLDLVDVGICAAFLSEFCWRLLLAPGRFTYLRRYGLVDLLPAIPWALFVPSGEGTKALRGLRILPRIMRPLRLLAFAVRGMDRLVRRYAGVLNRNVVMFQPGSEDSAREQDRATRLAHLEERLVRKLRLQLGSVAPESRQVVLQALVEAAVVRLEGMPSGRGKRFLLPPGQDGEMRLEELVRDLQDVEPEDVEDTLGADVAERLLRFLRLLDLPLLRRLPLIRAAVPGLRERGTFTALARAAQGLGRALERFQETLSFWGDLRGIITGPQILDRVGSAIVRVTQRPAVRLPLIGLLVLLVAGFVELFPFPWLRERFDQLSRLLGMPLIILGIVCLTLQIFGRWLRHLAGEAGEIFRRIAEAQDVNLLEVHKRDSRVADLGELFDQVLAEELRADPVLPTEWSARRRAAFVGEANLFLTSEHARSGYELHKERVLGLYEDYLDGAVLHKSDVKSTEQFLGNLVLMTIRRERLRFSRRDIRALESLDLSTGHALPTGPSLWFQFITDTLAERTARLVLEFNLHAVPLAHAALVQPERMEAMRRWLERRDDDTGRQRNRRLLAQTPLGVTRFSALHFLASDARRDQQVAAEFGPAVLDRLLEDRRAMIRSVFGTYPYENLPRNRRTLNPYNHYFGWLGRGLFLLLPARVFLRFLLYAGRGLRMLGQIIREQLRPRRFVSDAHTNWAPLSVAWRKVGRMRRPIYLAALDLRARFDPEYVHARIPGCGSPGERFHGVTHDLDLIGASEADHQRFRRRARRAATWMLELETWLVSRGWPEISLVEALDPDLGPPDDRENEHEMLRAVGVAWHINYENCRTLLRARARLDKLLRQALEIADEEGFKQRRGLRDRKLETAFQAWLEGAPDLAADPEIVRRLRGAVAADHGGVRPILLAVHGAGGEARARREARQTLARAARYPMPWSQQLVTLRAVQTLTCLDVIGTRRVVTALGGWDDSP